MKKVLGLILFLVMLLLSVCPALGEGSMGRTPLYTARSDTRFLIRQSPDEKSRKLKTVPDFRTVYVYEYGPEWCLISYENTLGYCKTKWIHRFLPLDPLLAPMPGAHIQAGIAQVTDPVFVRTKKYAGNTLAAGDLLSVTSWEDGQAVIPMMRETADIPAGHLTYTPFVPWADAQPGDVIGGFTTYFHVKAGDTLGENRQFNIEFACEKVSGAVVPPDGLFSFNALSGRTIKANGYKLARNISLDGKGYGGGVCQVATTIFNAGLGLPLKIVEWSVHQDSGVTYVPRDFDAAVSDYSDFVFRNLLPYPIKITAVPQNGVLTVIIARDPG